MLLLTWPIKFIVKLSTGNSFCFELRKKIGNNSFWTLNFMKMKRWSGGAIIVFLLTLLVLRYGLFFEDRLTESFIQSQFSHNSSEHLYLLTPRDVPAVPNPGNTSQVVSTDMLVSSLFTPKNLSADEVRSLQTWELLDHLINCSDGLPNALDAIKEAQVAWENLVTVVEEEKLDNARNGSGRQRQKEKQCPYSIKKMNTSEFNSGGFKLKIPCGMVQGSSVTIIGSPDGLVGNFRIDLTGPALPGDPDPPIILHYNVRLKGDKNTENPVIVQNTWTPASDWGEEERCPPPDGESKKKVDDLEECNPMVGKHESIIVASNKHNNTSRQTTLSKKGAKPRAFFPFRQGYLAVATIRAGVEGIQMSVDGKHISSFAYRESLEPWLVSEVNIAGDIKLISVLASGLPTSEDLDHVIDLEYLKSPDIPPHKSLYLLIGIFSTANNFKRRMAVRRTWMQYDAVRSGAVAVRFFVGLHKNQAVNEELWNEARTYGDIQLMPFVDYYSLITWKTLAICIYGTKVSAKYVMKTDDDSFVRVDEILSSLHRINATNGLLYGRINYDTQPHRDSKSKWFISPEDKLVTAMRENALCSFQHDQPLVVSAPQATLSEWSEDKYPPWANGPGYVVSLDIAKSVYKKYKKGHLKIFKLEDVAMGIWVYELKKKGLNITYANEERVNPPGCDDGYVVAHYQVPRKMLCLWRKLKETQQARCCGD